MFTSMFEYTENTILLSWVFWEYYSCHIQLLHPLPSLNKQETFASPVHVLRFNNNHATTCEKNTNYYNCKGSSVENWKTVKLNISIGLSPKHSFPIWIILLFKLDNKDNFKENYPKRKSCFWKLLENQVPICAGYTRLFDL